MAKFKVYELAKELEKSSKEVLAFLQEKGVEVKAAQSSVDDAAADMVRKHFDTSAQSVKATEEPKVETAKTEAPKADIVSGTKIKSGTRVTLTSETDNAVIYYTTDSEIGRNLTAENGIRFEDSIEITGDTVLYAFAKKEGRIDRCR